MANNEEMVVENLAEVVTTEEAGKNGTGLIIGLAVTGAATVVAGAVWLGKKIVKKIKFQKALKETAEELGDGDLDFEEV